uniref:Uncharacterized protein n=1 Tax=Setaria italica TaxID=4555 RepID=K3YWR7_SETIT
MVYLGSTLAQAEYLLLTLIHGAEHTDWLATRTDHQPRGSQAGGDSRTGTGVSARVCSASAPQERKAPVGVERPGPAVGAPRLHEPRGRRGVAEASRNDRSGSLPARHARSGSINDRAGHGLTT